MERGHYPDESNLNLVCMCLCAYACVCVHVCVFLCAYVCEFVFVCMCVWLASACWCAFLWLCVHLCAISTHPTHCIAFAKNSVIPEEAADEWLAPRREMFYSSCSKMFACPVGGANNLRTKMQSKGFATCWLQQPAKKWSKLIEDENTFEHFILRSIKYKRISPWLPGIGVIFSWAIVYFLKTVSPFI